MEVLVKALKSSSLDLAIVIVGLAAVLGTGAEAPTIESDRLRSGTPHGIRIA